MPKGIPLATEEERLEARRAKVRRWRARNRDKVNAKQREAKRANREASNKRQREYRAANPEKYRQTAARWREANRDLAWAYWLKNIHCLSPGDWNAMWQSQGGRCYLCGDELPLGKDTHIDHDHACCGRRRSCKACQRGLSCSRCNRLIGLAGDDPDRIKRIAAALRAAKAATAKRRAASRQQEMPLSA